MHYFKTLSILATTTAALAMPVQAHADDMMISQIFEMGSSFCPRGSVRLDGQLLAVNSNMALFSLLGTTYGGDGRTTFGIPDMRGRSPVHAGRGPGLNDIRLGNKGGTEYSSVNPGGGNAQVNDKLFTGANKISTSVSNRDPYMAITYCMATQGIFPSRP